MILDFQKCYYLVTLPLTIQKIHLFYIPQLNISSHLRDLKSLFLTLFDIHAWLFYLPLIIFIFFHFFFKFSFFHWAISYYIDLVFTLFDHVTLGYGFWCSGCFLSFLFVNMCLQSQKKACPNYLTKLTYDFIN